MKRIYIHSQAQWPNFTWNGPKIAPLLLEAARRQGWLLGKMDGLGFEVQLDARALALTEEVIQTSAIEGEYFDASEVRSSLATKLGLTHDKLDVSNPKIDGVVEMMLDATQNFDLPLTENRLFAWQAGLFPTGYAGAKKVKVGRWRDDTFGPMQVVSGQIGNETVHFEAPHADRINAEIQQFLKWFEEKGEIDLILKAGIAHFWFVTLHPFEDGNGRVSRAIADLMLSRGEKNSLRFYSVSAQIQEERSSYYKVLEVCQSGDLDITRWLEWFLNCYARAIVKAEKILENVLRKTRFWQRANQINLSIRQHKILSLLLDGFEGKLTTSKYAKLTKTSQDTALRDLTELVEAGLLNKGHAGGRSTSYAINFV